MGTIPVVAFWVLLFRTNSCGMGGLVGTVTVGSRVISWSTSLSMGNSLGSSSGKTSLYWSKKGDNLIVFDLFGTVRRCQNYEKHCRLFRQLFRLLSRDFENFGIQLDSQVVFFASWFWGFWGSAIFFRVWYHSWIWKLPWSQCHLRT